MLCIVFTIPKPALHFLWHVPNIISHFQHHNEQEHMGFVDFLKEHTDLPRHQDTENEHQHLPWNHTHSTESLQVISILPQIVTDFAISPVVEYGRTVKVIMLPQYYQFQYQKAIWQPPRPTS